MSDSSELQKWLDLWVDHESKRPAIDKERIWCQALSVKIRAAEALLTRGDGINPLILDFVQATINLDRSLLACNQERHDAFDTRSKTISEGIARLKAEALGATIEEEEV